MSPRLGARGSTDVRSLIRQASGFKRATLVETQSLQQSRDTTYCPLSAEEEQRFALEGVLALPPLCGASELLEIRGILLGLLADRTGFEEGNQLDMLGEDRPDGRRVQPQIIMPSLYRQRLLKTDYFQQVQAIARQLLGPEARFSFDHCILKTVGSDTATPWHQDEAHRHDPLYHCAQISFWMPLQDASVENGCMRYVPGSHLGPLLPHRSAGDDTRMHALECLPGTVDVSLARSCPAPAGACILHAGRTIHGAAANTSARDRLAYIVSFRGPTVARAVPERMAWLEAQLTPAAERHRQWLRRGGVFVLAARWLRRVVRSKPRQIVTRLVRLPQRLVLRARSYRASSR